MGSSSRARLRGLLLGSTLVFGIATSGFGVHPPSSPTLDVDRMAPAALSQADAAAARDALQRSDAWLDWSRNHPTWRVSWNLRTRTAHRMFGAGVRVDRPLHDAASVDAACRELLSQQSALTGVTAADLRLAAADHRLGRWYVVFEQVRDGLPVRGARADVRLTDDGSVQVFGADWHRNPSCDRQARITPEAALAAAATDLGATTEVAHELVIVPEAQAAGHIYRLVREVRFRTAAPAGLWHAWVDAHSGELLRRENLIRHAQLTGQITAAVEAIQPGDPLEDEPLADTRFNVGTGMTEFGFTDAAGNFDVTTAATDSVDVRVRLLGRFGRVFNAQLGFATPTIDARMFPGTSRDFHWDDSNSRTSERDAYYHANLAHQAIKELDPAFTGVDYQMPIVVDLFDRDCNAFYDGLGINFLGESMRCANTARLANVVYHEYAHAITDRQYRPFFPSGAMHEGFSDYFACSIENDPHVGRGFRGPGTFLRTIDNTNTFPDDATGEVHRDGLIIGGALWDLRELLGAGATDSLFHYARYGRADNFDDYLLDVLVTDDDNGNIYDGTPRFDAIVASFSAHGIGDYSVQISHEPEPDTEDADKPLVIEAVILSIFALDAPTVQLHYAIDGGAWNVLTMTATGAGVREYAATIPQQAAETDVQYYITASDVQGHSATLPAQGVGAPFEFRIGVDATPPVIVHESLPDQPLDAPAGWTVRGFVTDNLDHGLAGVALHWGRNTGTPTDTTAMTAVAPDEWLATLPAAGVNLGDTFVYRLVATDSAQAPNTASSPSTGSHSFTVVPGLARDLQASDGGLLGSGDWEWGEPESGPPAFSGTNVWGTGIHGSYSDDTESILELGPIDLATWTAGALVFQHWLDCETFFDGGHVQVSTDGGLNWTTIEPSGGYPSGFVLSLADAGFSGESPGWQRIEFELSAFVGQQVLVRWRFASDSGVTGPGWFVDDIEFVARQVLSVPLQLTAEDGLDSQVPLAWSPPAGIDPEAPATPLNGYNVYRAAAADLSDAVQLNAAPLAATATTFLDETAVNGDVSYYAVTALYDDGESRRSTPAAGQAYVAGYAADVAALDVRVDEVAPADTSIVFSNTGTGFLNLNVWLGEASDTSIDQVRIAYDRGPGPVARTAARVQATGGLHATAPAPLAGITVPAKGGNVIASPLATATAAATAAATATATARPRFADLISGWRQIGRVDPGLMPTSNAAARSGATAASARAATPSRAGGDPYTPLFTDSQEGGVTPDIKELAVEENINGETRFRISGWEAWGNPLTDFTVLIGMDTDANRGTGDDNGNDFYVLMGAFAFANFGVPAGIVQGQTLVAIPTHQFFPAGSDFLEVGFSLAPFANPKRLILQVLAFDAALQVPRDFAPNVPTTFAWLEVEAFRLEVEAGIPSAFGVHFPGVVPPGDYSGKIFLETNATTSPVVVIPVDYHLATTAIELHDLTAAQESGDMIVGWRTASESDVVAFRVHRSRDGGALEALAPDVAPSPSREYTFRDRDLAPGTYTYRVGEVAGDGSVTLHGAVNATMTRVAPAVSFLDPAVPNPFNPTTTLRFGTAVPGPAEVVVYDSRGRRVRTLWSAAHVEPGFHHVAWDGRDDHGSRVASGVYHARLQTAGRAFTRRLTLVK